MSNFRVHQLTEKDVSRIQTALDGVEQDAIVVRPHKDNSGIFGMDEVLRSLPRADTKRGGLLRQEKNTSAPFAFEMRYAPDPVASTTNDERVLSLQYVGGDERTTELLGRQLPDKYPDSRTEVRSASWLTPSEGQHMAVATLGLRRYTLYPLKNVELDEFRNDPTGSILTEMVGAADAGGVDADVAVQIMARPAGKDWKGGVPGGYGVADTYGDGLTEKEEKVTSPLSTQKLRWFLNQSTYEKRPILPTPVGKALGWMHPFFRDEFKHPPSKADKQAAKMLSDLDGRGWEFHVRIVAVSDDPDLARNRVVSTAEMFDNFYEYRGAQTFVPIPKNGSEAIDVATEAAGREWPANREQRMIKPQIEVAGLTNIPEAKDVSTNKLRWALASPGDGIPPGTPRFAYDAHGLDAATASREETQVAMLDAAGDDEPLWYGTGVKYGTEAGVFQDTLYHQFVGGATRCHAKGSQLLMYDGRTKAVENVREGELLMGPDSTPREVTRTHQGVSHMFRIIPNKGKPFTVTADHKLTLVRTNCKYVYDGPVTDVSVADWIGWSKTKKHNYKLLRKGVKFEEPNNLPIDPYMLGVLIGDGGLADIIRYSPPRQKSYEKKQRSWQLHGDYPSQLFTLMVTRKRPLDTGLAGLKEN